MKLASIFFVVFSIISSPVLFAQGGLNNIYSAYGIGDVELRDKNGYAGMGGVGIALPSGSTLNDLNPASYAHFPYSRFMFELSLGGRSSNYISSTSRTSGADFSIQKAAMGFSLFKNLGTAFGLRRYSTIDYRTNSNRFVVGTDAKLASQINGSGGLYQFNVSNGYSVTKRLQIGISIGYLFGSIQKKETITTAEQELNITQRINYTKMLYNFGVQYSIPVQTGKWTLGATYQPERRLQQLNDDFIVDGDGVTVVSTEQAAQQFRYPSTLGLGAAYSKGNWTFSFDMVQQQWKNTGYRGTGFAAGNGTNLAAGFRKTSVKKTVFGTVPGSTFSGGISFDQSYLKLYNFPINTVSGSLGLTLTSKNGAYFYHVALKGGQRGTSVYPLVKEQFFETQFSLSLGALLYKGGRKYD